MKYECYGCGRSVGSARLISCPRCNSAVCADCAAKNAMLCPNCGIELTFNS